MTRNEFQKHLEKAKRPTVVEFWAPWCAPCRMMLPALEQAKEQYKGRVDLMRINADQNPDILRSLRVMSIPTMIGYQEGKEIIRKTGAQPLAGIVRIFESTLVGEPIKRTLTVYDRALRAGTGLALALITWQFHWSAFFFVIGGVLLFSAVYDRCPIYNAIMPRLKSVFQRQG